MHPANRKFSSILDKLCSRNCAVCAVCWWGSAKNWVLPWRKNRQSITQGYVCSFSLPFPLRLSLSLSLLIMVSIECKHLFMISVGHQPSIDIALKYAWEGNVSVTIIFVPGERAELWLWWSHLFSGTECIWTVAVASKGSVKADSSQAHTYLTHSSLVCSPWAVWFGLCVIKD